MDGVYRYVLKMKIYYLSTGTTYSRGQNNTLQLATNQLICFYPVADQVHQKTLSVGSGAEEIFVQKILNFSCIFGHFSITICTN